MGFFTKIFNDIRGVLGEGNDELILYMILFLLFPGSKTAEGTQKRTDVFGNGNVVFFIVLLFLFFIISDRRK